MHEHAPQLYMNYRGTNSTWLVERGHTGAATGGQVGGVHRQPRPQGRHRGNSIEGAADGSSSSAQISGL